MFVFHMFSIVPRCSTTFLSCLAASYNAMRRGMRSALHAGNGVEQYKVGKLLASAAKHRVAQHFRARWVSSLGGAPARRLLKSAMNQVDRQRISGRTMPRN